MSKSSEFNNTKEQARTIANKAAMVKAMQKSLGVVTTACKSVGIDRSTYYIWYKDDPEFAAECDACSEIALDFAESQLHKQIQNGTPVSTIFYLKTKGKKRGYIERQEMEHSGEIQTGVVILPPKQISDYTAEQ